MNVNFRDSDVLDSIGDITNPDGIHIRSVSNNDNPWINSFNAKQDRQLIQNKRSRTSLYLYLLLVMSVIGLIVLFVWIFVPGFGAH